MPGYTVRTRRYRFTEWVYVEDEGLETQAPIWDEDQHADWGELYDLWTDPQENTNLYRWSPFKLHNIYRVTLSCLHRRDDSWANVKTRLSGILHQGWTGYNV